MNNSKELIEQITKGIQEKKGHNIVIVDLSDIEDTICNYFVICQGNSPTQLMAITDAVKDAAHEGAGQKPIATIGLQNAQWVAMDYGDVLVHIFLPEIREFYDLEHLWADAKLEKVPELD